MAEDVKTVVHTWHNLTFGDAFWKRATESQQRIMLLEKLACLSRSDSITIRDSFVEWWRTVPWDFDEAYHYAKSQYGLMQKWPWEGLNDQ